MINATISAPKNLTEHIAIGRGEKGDTGDVTPEALAAAAQAEEAAESAQDALDQVEVHAASVAASLVQVQAYAADVALANEAAASANQAAGAANAVKADLLQKLAAGEFNGAAGPQGPPGAKGETGPQGPKGDTPALANNLTTTTAGMALDSTQGHILANQIGALSSLSTTEKGSVVSAVNELQSTSTNLQGQLNQLSETLGNAPEFIVDETSGKITGYKTAAGGADTVYPFSSNFVMSVTVTGKLDAGDAPASFSKTYEITYQNGTFSYEGTGGSPLNWYTYGDVEVWIDSIEVNSITFT